MIKYIKGQAHYIIVVSTLVFVLLTTVAFAILHHEDESKISWGSFSLLNQNNEAVTSEMFRGSWLVVYFGFTSCSNVCPVQLSNISNAVSSYTENNPQNNILPVLITVDPARDTPQKMKSYLQHFDVPMIGVTGPEDHLKNISKQFKAFFQKDSSNDKEILHSNVIYVISPNGQIVERLVGDKASEEIQAVFKTIVNT